MRRLAFALTLLLSTAGCSDPDADTDDTDTVMGTSGDPGSTGGESGTEEGGESSGGLEEWTGLSADFRVITREVDDPGFTCSSACGAVSTCLGILDPDFPDRVRDCDDSVEPGAECFCAEFSDTPDERSTHAFSGCFLNPNSSSAQAVDPPKWDQRSCDDYCGSFGFSCMGTVWGVLKNCPNITEQWPSFFPEGPTVRPHEVDGPDGVFVAICEM
jgi:hypothetical protein